MPTITLDHRIGGGRRDGPLPPAGLSSGRVRQMMWVSGTSVALTPYGFSPYSPNGRATS
jgi:hypothetical protein